MEFDADTTLHAATPFAYHHIPPPGTRIPFAFSSSIVIRPTQHIIPALRGVFRGNLQGHISQAATRPITLLIASSGMGKTTELARFCRDQLHMIPLWYTLDSGTTEPHTMLAHLFWALMVVAPMLGERLQRDAVLFHSGQADWTDVLTHWLDALHDTPKPILLCVDVVGTLSPRLTTLFGQLIRRLHPRLRIILAMETQPDDLLWTECLRLRSHGHLTILADDVFALSSSEVYDLCLFHGHTVSEQDASLLQQLSGGWPYLLDMVLHTQRGRPMAAILQSVVSFEQNPDVDALTAATLTMLFSEADIACIVASSVASQLTDPIVTATCQLPVGAALLAHWYALIPMIQCIEPGVYVYHRLFRSFLQRRFLRLPELHRNQVLRASAEAAIIAGDWPEAIEQLITHGNWDMLCAALEPRAMRLVLDRRLDGSLTEVLNRLSESPRWATSPWLLCYQAMEQRITRGDYNTTRRFGQMAIKQFLAQGNTDGHVRALAEVAIAHYHLGQYTTALTELASAPSPTLPSCAAALAYACYLNHIGIGALEEAIAAAHQGLHILHNEPDVLRRMTWRITIQRNLAVAYHFQGRLGDARIAAEDALDLTKQYYMSDYAYVWGLYEIGLLEQRAGRLDVALIFLRRARDQIERSISNEALWRWIVAAEGHTLRDGGHLDAAAERYRLGGWGEGDEGPLMLWLLQGHYVEARCAAEARQAAAHASASSFEALNLTVFLALLDFEVGATWAICTTLRTAATQYADLGFRYYRAAVQFHLAAVESDLGEIAASTQTLTEALTFGAEQGYLNFAWWHPIRMQTLLHRAFHAGIAKEYCVHLLRERGLAPPHVEDRQSLTLDMRQHIAESGESYETLVTLHSLGMFEVWINGKILPRKHWQGHRAGAVRMQRMLLYLARHREPQTIDAIVRYVWPDIWNRIDTSTNFHLTLAGLRRVFEPDLDQGSASRFVLTTSQGYQLLPSLNILVDLDQFQAYMRSARLADAAGDQASARAAFTEAERLYTGDFALAKPDPGEAEEYHRTHLEAVRWLAHDDLRRNAFESCIARSRRLLREDSWDITASTLLIAAYLSRGNRRAARQQYERFVQLHGQPSPEIMRLARAHWL